MNVIMMGPPGAGKGTQAERVAHARGIPQISTGEILREAVQARTELGRRARAIMDTGHLVSDDVMIGIVRDRLEREDARRGFVLDGFPRTVAQARALDCLLAVRQPLIVIDIVVPEQELVRRLRSRRICQDCRATAGGFNEALLPPTPVSRSVGGSDATNAAFQWESCRRCGGRLVERSDDSESAVRERLKVYLRETKPLVDYYRTRPTFRSIDGAQPPERVAADLAAAIESAAAAANERRSRAAMERPL